MRVKFGLFWGIIESILRFLAKVVYTVFAVLHLGPLFVYALVGGIIHLIWNVFEKGTWAFTAYHIVGAILLVYAVITTLCSILGIGKVRKKDKRDSRMNIVERDDEREEYRERERESEVDVPERKERPRYKEKRANKTYPIYSTVKQNPSYFMAEYEDRYELYYKTSEGYKHIRTDYKKE